MKTTRIFPIGSFLAQGKEPFKTSTLVSLYRAICYNYL